MNDHELDELLTQLPMSPTARSEAVDALVTNTRRQVERERRPRRRTAVIGVAIGAVLLSAGGTLTASQLRIPPFQGLEPGLQRSAAHIPVNYRDLNGDDYRCQYFIEYRDLDRDQIQQVERFISDSDWSGLGSRLYEEAEARGGDWEAIHRRAGDAVSEEIEDRTRKAFPEIPYQPVDGQGFSGGAMWCAVEHR